jgi:hypothetical protein
LGTLSWALRAPSPKSRVSRSHPAVPLSIA